MIKWGKHYRIYLGVFAFLFILLLVFYYSKPKQLFSDPTSTVIEDRNGRLLGAKIASDGQWRFPANNNIPDNYKKAVLEFEDQYFNSHPGVNLFSIFRALYLNIKNGEIVSGGSTITMQVIRLSRKGKSRTIKEKLIEMAMAMRLELSMTKSEIFELYASNAPFGGNVVGLEAASWRYYRRPSFELSWAEVSTLAVLPNAPSLIYPGKNQPKLIQKRNRLLKKLLEKGIIDALTFELAIEEPLPGKPLPLEQVAPHLLSRVYVNNNGEKIKTTLDYNFQKQVTSIVQQHHNVLKYNGVFNAAVLVVKVETGEVVAYVGNTSVEDSSEHGSDIDIIMASRSTGSILKPILYAAMLDEGLILPKSLIPDVPVHFGGFTPMNFDRKYAGAVSADQALYRSLNVPAVKMLQDYGVPGFYKLLKNVGMTTLNNSSDHYGLSLILGGAETNMWDLATIYSSFSRALNHFYEYNGLYDKVDWHAPNFVYHELKTKMSDASQFEKRNNLSAASIWFAYEAMRKVNRPEELAGWDMFSSSRKIAWKTGTSFGFRDAWAVGTSTEYVAVVWVGNADGEGRPGLTGVSSAAPILFDVFNVLPESEWFDPPYDEMIEIEVCKQSGFRAGLYCHETDTLFVQRSGLKSENCTYHSLIHLDSTAMFRVNSDCYNPSNMIHKPWFVLPPVMEWYYKQTNPFYKPLPEFSKECFPSQQFPMEFIYPRERSRFFIPVNLNQSREDIIFEVAHQNEKAILYWHLNDEFLGTTQQNHQFKFHPEIGEHEIIVVDDAGNSLSKRIEILSR